MSLLKTWLLAAASTFLAVSLILFPKEALEASLNGMAMWWDVVFPALLPFFILSELLIGFGVVAFIGTILEPLMRPIFRVPGAGGFVWAMGLASGNPAGAKLAARLRQDRLVSRIEGERLAAFTNSSNPLFIFGAIAVGFFHDASLGLLLACAHYVGNILVGILMRFYGRKEEDEQQLRDSIPKKFSIAEAVSRMHEERIRDERPIGRQLGDAVQSSVRTLLMVGGFIILFSVLNQMLSLIGFTAILAASIAFLFSLFQLSPDLSIPFISGIFEITSGAKLSSLSDASLLDKVIVTSFFVAFGGLSIQAQVASILSETDLRFKPFFLGRIAHGLLSACLVWLLWDPLYLKRKAVETSNGATGVSYTEWLTTFWSSWLDFAPYLTLMTLLIAICLKSNSLLRSS